MKLLMLLASMTCMLSAVSGPNPVIMWAYVTPIPTVSIPTVSEYQSAFGIAVNLYSDDQSVEAYIVTVSYRVPSTGATVTTQRIVIRQDPKQWCPVIIWTGVPAVVISIRAQGLVTKESSETR